MDEEDSSREKGQQRNLKEMIEMKNSRKDSKGICHKEVNEDSKKS